MITRKYLAFLKVLFVMSIVMLPVMLMAQDGPAAPDAMDNEGMWQYIIAIVTPFIVGGIKMIAPKIPKVLLPVSTPFVGLAVGFALNALAGANLDALTMAKMGGLAVLIRETWSQTLKSIPPSGSAPA